MPAQFDPEKYRKYVDHYEVDEEHKLELMRQVWAIMESFVDRAFGESSEQILLGKSQKKSPKTGPISLGSTHILTPIFKQAAAPIAPDKKDP